MSSTPPGLRADDVRLTGQSAHAKRRWPARLAAVAIAVTAIGFAAAPAAADPSDSPSAGAPSVAAGEKTFTEGITGDIDSLNPYSGFLSISYEVYGETYDLLEGWSKNDLSPTPGLADSWSHTDDGLTWTFKIHQGATWSDGQPVTASDVAYTFNRAINDETANSQYYNYVKNIKSVDAPDASTAVFHMIAEDPIMTQLWVPILPEHIWKDVSKDDSGTFKNTPMVGSGPFTLVEWSPNQFIKLKANKSYWGGAPKIDNLIYRIYKNEDAAIAALEKGEIDSIDAMSSTSYLALQGKAGVTRVDAVGGGFDEIGFNSGAQTTDNIKLGDGAPAATDPKFRTAVAYAIDLKGMTEKVLKGFGQPATTSSIIPTEYSNFAYTADAADAHNYDPTKAAQLLDAAGYTKGADGFRIDKATGKAMNLRLYTTDDTPAYKDDIAYIAQYLKDVGIQTTTKLYQADKLTDIIGHGEYDLFVWGWGVEPDPSFQLSTMTCDQRTTGTKTDPVAGWSDSYYCNPAYDALYAQSSKELDPTKRADLVKQMQQLLYQDSPYIVMYYADDLEAYNSSKWTGVVHQPGNMGAKGYIFAQYGNYTNLGLDIRTDAPKSDGGIPTWVIVAASVVVIVAIAGAVPLAMRRRTQSDERE